MPSNPRDWIYWGLTVGAAVCTVGAAVAVVPAGWSWPAFFGAAGTALAGLAKLWGTSPNT